MESNGVFWGVLAPVIAIVLTLAAAQTAVILTGAIRNRDYRRFEDKSREDLAQQYNLPTIFPSTAEDRYRSLSRLVRKTHTAANAAQTRYHNAVVRSAGC